MATRDQNEKKFRNWLELPDGGRRYWKDRRGAVTGWQRMVKVVDGDENTLLIVQEVYNDNNDLIERHQKYPVDTGHQVLNEDENA